MIIGSAETIIKWLFQQDRGKLYEIKEKSKKRSLTQNSYSWALIGEIADKIRLSKEEVYLKMLREYSQYAMVSIRADIDPAGYIKYFDEIGESETNGNTFKHYKVYKGNSEMDTREMAIFLDGIIQEANDIGIPTLTPNEVKKLKLI